MSEKKPRVNFKEANLRLAKVDYTMVKTEAKNVQVFSIDEITEKDVTADGFILVFTRKLSLEPASNFDITVVFELTCHFSDESSKSFGGDLEKIKAFIEKRKKEIIESWRAPALASTIISNLTMIDALNPLVTIPMFKNKD